MHTLRVLRLGSRHEVTLQARGIFVILFAAPQTAWTCQRSFWRSYSSTSDDSDDSDDSDSSDAKPAAAAVTSDSDDSDDDEEEESEATVVATEPAAKKQRTNAGNSREATEQRVPTPFKRVDTAAIEAEFGWGDSSKVEGHKLIDNSWDALRAKGHTYADKAQERLGPVKGKDFRKQMTKAKRGTYMCGAIDGNAVNSIKYPDSD